MCSRGEHIGVQTSVYCTPSDFFFLSIHAICWTVGKVTPKHGYTTPTLWNKSCSLLQLGVESSSVKWSQEFIENTEGGQTVTSTTGSTATNINNYIDTLHEFIAQLSDPKYVDQIWEVKKKLNRDTVSIGGHTRKLDVACHSHMGAPGFTSSCEHNRQLLHTFTSRPFWSSHVLFYCFPNSNRAKPSLLVVRAAQTHRGQMFNGSIRILQSILTIYNTLKQVLVTVRQQIKPSNTLV